MSRLSSARRLALEVTSQVRERNSYVSNAVNSIVRHAEGVSAKDRAFAELLSTGVVSTWGTLDEIIDRALGPKGDLRPYLRDAVRIATYELVFLRKEDHVVVDQGVELAKVVEPKAAGFINVLLRRIADSAKGFPWGNPAKSNEALARKHGFPYWMTDMLVESFGRDNAAQFMDASNQPAPLFLAVNSIKCTPAEAMEILQSSGANAHFVGPEDRGCILAENQAAALRSGLLADGRVLVSDASAQLAALVATPPVGARYLEIGSGRGTKSVLLQSNAVKYNGEQARLWCVDLHAFKNAVLERRLAQCGVSGAVILEGDATDLDSIEGLPDEFDAALIDAPCSGIGTLRRHPEIRWRITASDIDAMGRMGLSMLKSASRRIVDGGSIVYSTCTITHEENMDVIQAFLGSAEGSGWSIDAESGSGVVQTTLRPGGPDVHFIVKLKKGD